jgi:magnesium chelatase family protein
LSRQKSRNQKIVISLAPADLKKEGPMFDLPIALSYLLAADDIRFDPEPYIFIGELALDGTVRPVRGLLPLVAEAKKRKKAVFVPKENAEEAALAGGIEVYGVETLQEVIDFLNTKKDKLSKTKEHKQLIPAPQTKLKADFGDSQFAFEDIRGQESPSARRLSPPQADTTWASRARPAPARPCWRARSPRFCRRSL